jgi:hypothetical protein
MLAGTRRGPAPAEQAGFPKGVLVGVGELACTLRGTDEVGAALRVIR